MHLDSSTLVAIVGTATLLFLTMGNLCDAIEHFIVRFRRLKKTISGRVQRK